MVQCNTDRRTVLKATSSLLVMGSAGCSGMGLGSSGPKYDPEEYGGTNPDALLLTVDAFPDGWKQLDHDEFRAFSDASEEIVVMFYMKVDDEVSTTKDEFETTRQKYPNANDFDLGDECFFAERNGERADLYLRDSNARAQVTAMHQSGLEWKPDINRATNYAEELYAHWQSVVGDE